MQRRFTRIPVIIGLPVVLLLAAALEDNASDMLRGYEILGSVYKHVISEYVDEVSVEELMQAGVDGMLKSLDPYAELIERRENSDVDALSRGSYGGLGIKVRIRDGVHYVSDIYPQVRPLTTLRIGDILLAVDDHNIDKEKITDLRSFLRGTPGSTVQLLVRRPGISDSLPLVVQRRRITLNPITYHTMLDDGMFYLKLNRFTRSSADSVRRILGNALAAGGVRGVIVDVRDNPGGLLEAAVALVNQFVAQGTPIVSMRGRQAAYAREYPAREPAMDTEVPVAILVNGRSASASEIVAGAFQDLDRGIIIGERTFGKGLVQTLVPLSHAATLKLTTSRYYLPSGRCIQRIVYRNGEAEPRAQHTDSTLYRTALLNRTMRESIGIIPDVLMEPDSLPADLRCLSDNDGIFRFVTLWNNQQKQQIPPAIDEHMKRQFRKFYDSLSVVHGGPLLTAYRQLEQAAERYTLSSKTRQNLDDLQHALSLEEREAFDRCWPMIEKLLTEEFAMHLLGEHAVIELGLPDDEALHTAQSLLADKDAQRAAMLTSQSY